MKQVRMDLTTIENIGDGQMKVTLKSYQWRDFECLTYTVLLSDRLDRTLAEIQEEALVFVGKFLDERVVLAV